MRSLQRALALSIARGVPRFTLATGEVRQLILDEESPHNLNYTDIHPVRAGGVD